MTPVVPQPDRAVTAAFLRGGGECGARIRAVDWSQSVLGASETWPSCLKTTLAIMLNARQPMFLWWGPELIQFYNDAYVPSFGSGKHPGAMGQRGADCWPENWSIIYPQIRDAMEHGIASWNEDQLVPVFRNGRIEDAYWTYGYSPVFDEQGAIAGVLVLCQETTGKVLACAEALWARQQAEISRDRLLNMVQSAPVFVCMLSGPDHVVTLLNSLCQRLVGPDRNLVGRVLAEAMPEIAAQGFVAILDDVYRHGRIYHGEEMLVHLARHDDAELEQAYVTFVFQPRRDADGAVDGIDVYGFDVTEQVKARLVALSAAERNRALTDAIPQQTWTADTAGRIEFVSPKTVAFFGVPRTRLLGTGWHAFVHPDDLPGTLARWRQSLANGEECNMELRLRRADGEYRWHHKRAVPVRDAAGCIVQWFGTNTDVHDQRRAREELTQRAEFERQLSGIVSYDLRGTLNEILVAATEVVTRDLDSSVAKNVMRIQSAAQRAVSTLRELLQAIRRPPPLHLE